MERFLALGLLLMTACGDSPPPHAAAPAPSAAPAARAEAPQPCDPDPLAHDPELQALRTKLCGLEPSCCAFDGDLCPRALTQALLDEHSRLVLLQCNTFGYNHEYIPWVVPKDGAPRPAPFAPPDVDLGAVAARKKGDVTYIVSPVFGERRLTATYCMRRSCDEGQEVEYTWSGSEFRVARVRALEAETASVQVRLRNTCKLPLQQVVVGFPEQSENYGDVAPQQATEYHVVQSAYAYAHLRGTIGTVEVLIQPIDYLGESLLAPGKYTYVLSDCAPRKLDRHGRIRMTLAVDEASKR